MQADNSVPSVSHICCSSIVLRIRLKPCTDAQSLHADVLPGQQDSSKTFFAVFVLQQIYQLPVSDRHFWGVHVLTSDCLLAIKRVFSLFELIPAVLNTLLVGKGRCYFGATIGFSLILAGNIVVHALHCAVQGLLYHNRCVYT